MPLQLQVQPGSGTEQATVLDRCKPTAALGTSDTSPWAIGSHACRDRPTYRDLKITARTSHRAAKAARTGALS